MHCIWISCILWTRDPDIESLVPDFPKVIYLWSNFFFGKKNYHPPPLLKAHAHKTMSSTQIFSNMQVFGLNPTFALQPACKKFHLCCVLVIKTHRIFAPKSRAGFKDCRVSKYLGSKFSLVNAITAFISWL